MANSSMFSLPIVTDCAALSFFIDRRVIDRARNWPGIGWRMSCAALRSTMLSLIPAGRPNRSPGSPAPLSSRRSSSAAAFAPLPRPRSKTPGCARPSGQWRQGTLPEGRSVSISFFAIMACKVGNDSFNSDTVSRSSYRDRASPVPAGRGIGCPRYPAHSSSLAKAAGTDACRPPEHVGQRQHMAGGVHAARVQFVHLPDILQNVVQMAGERLRFLPPSTRAGPAGPSASHLVQ